MTIDVLEVETYPVAATSGAPVPVIRMFETGATRDTDTDKYEYAGFVSPLVLKRFAEYMHKNRNTAAGIRSSRNWRKGIPLPAYEESLMRHWVDVWLHLDGWPGAARDDYQNALCGLMFNVMGLLHEELIKEQGRGRIE